MIEKWLNTEMKVASLFDGRGSSTIIKTALFQPEEFIPPSIQAFINQVQPDPRYRYMHTIAMSDGDFFGSNLNGDVFREAELCGIQDPSEAEKNPDPFAGICIPRYQTFETANYFHHHDNTDFSPRFGNVPVAAWNAPMHRVELIIRIFVERDRDSAQILDNGGIIPVSMGCRIDHEQCRICQNRNQFIHQRCVHLRTMMNQILPDGRLVCADNIKPRFFDISRVTIPADPIALSLGKVAAFGGYMTAPRREKDVYDSMDRNWRSKMAEMEKQMPPADGGMQIGQIHPDSDPGCAAESAEAPSDFTAEDMKTMLDTTGNDLNRIVSTLAASGAVLSPIEFAHLVLEATTMENPAAIEKDAEVNAPTALSLDNFSLPLYHALEQKIAARSGFAVRGPASGWEPTKIAGPELVSDLYAYYRRLLGSLTIDHFYKSAMLNPALRKLTGNPVDHDRVKSAMYHLAYAGISTKLLSR